MTSLNHYDNLCLVTLPTPPSTPPPSSAASPSSPSSTGWTQNITKKIQELKNKENELNKLKETKNGYLPEQDSKSLDSLPTQVTSLETVKKLAEFADQLDTNKNDGNNILNNLCTGLESFLGFNPDSKGYDGQGIVYSDLDRLCDAVMGFLSGILSAVKNENAVTTYDNKAAESNLNSVLKKLQSSIGSGRKGLAASVEKVKAWLEGYGGEVNGKNDMITNPIKYIQKRIKTDKTLIELEENNDLARQITDWTGRADWYMKNINAADSALEYLDNNLRNKLSPKIDLLKQAMKTFQAAAGNNDLDAMFMLCSVKMDEVTKFISQVVAQSCEQFNDYLKKHTGNLLNKLYDLRDMKFKDLYDSVARLYGTLRDVYQGMEKVVRKYKTDLVGKLNTIVESSKQFKSDLRSTTTALTAVIGQLHSDLGRLQKLDDFKHLMVGQSSIVKAPLLTVIGGQSDPFESVTDYITRINTAIMDPVKEVMEHQGWKTVIEYCGESYMNNAFTNEGQGLKMKLLTPLTVLQKAVSGQVGGLDIAEVKISGIESLKTGKLNLQGQTSAIENVVTKLDANPPGEKITKAEMQPLFAALNNIIEQVTDHFEKVVTAAMKAIKERVSKEVKDVAGAIKEMVHKMQVAMKNDVETEKPDYGFAGISQTAKGLQRLVTEVQNNINAELETLQGSVGKEEEVKPMSSVYKDLRSLQANIGTLSTEVSNVSTKVTDVELQLEECVEAASTIYKEAPVEAEKFMKVVRNVVKRKIDHVFEDVQTKAKKLYKERKKEEMNALEQCAKRQYDAIEYVIHNNVNGGTKGFMKRLLIYFVDKIEDHATKLASDLQSPAAHPRLPDEQKTLKYFSNKLNDHFHLFLQEVSDSSVSPHLTPLSTKLEALLKRISKSKHFDYLVSDKYENLQNALDNFAPKKFGDLDSPLLAPLKSGLSKFAEQLGHAYVNRYSGEKMGKLLDVKPSSKNQKDAEKQPADPQTDNYDLTPEGRNCAKVCLTIVEILVNDFEKLFRATGSNKNMKINVDVGNKLGVYFRAKGYDVAKGASTQDGELQNTAVMTGEKIRKLFDYTIQVRNWGEYDPSTGKLHPIEAGTTTFDRWIRYLYVFLSKYRSVCHIKHIAKPRTPTTINQMLHWVDGLPYTTVYNELTIQGFGELFEKPEEEDPVGGDIVLKTEDDDKLSAYPEDITAAKLRDTLTDVCRFSDRVLVCILGHGHAEGRYACDFSTNPDGLLYPSNASVCLDMLVDILKRLYEQFYFLFIQCSRDKEHVSWRDCWYGRHVGGSDWRCNEKQCINQMGNRSPDQKANQTCGQTCDRHPSCGLKSPLQSFLEDGLPGFLPHTIRKPGCKLDCTVSNHRGLPCKTPMGFGDISVTASRASRGERLMKLLEVFCGQQTSPLTKLCGYFNCVLQMPPQTLGDMFAFYYSFIVGWGKSGQDHRSYAFEGAVNKAIFGQQYGELNVKSIITDDHQYRGATGDLMCLVSCKNASSSHTCGRYLQPISFTTWATFSEKHADKYLSWIVYLTETFYNLLEQLYEECCEKCGKQGTKCYDKSCRNGCPVKACREIKDVTKQQNGATHTNDCASIAQCPFTRPTLCRYGFVLKSLTNLRGATDFSTKRTCGDFCSTMKKVLNNVEADAAPLAKLIYVTIPKFLFEIRKPFMLLTLALWLLSFLYLLHIMVIRLDLLHIKSHLHTPSSHRIAAQSLLAAARVDKLNSVFYLQP